MRQFAIEEVCKAFGLPFSPWMPRYVDTLLSLRAASRIEEEARLAEFGARLQVWARSHGKSLTVPVGWSVEQIVTDGLLPQAEPWPFSLSYAPPRPHCTSALAYREVV